MFGYKIAKDYQTLTILATPDEQAFLTALREDTGDFGGMSHVESEVLEQLVCNSDLDWINPAYTGDLTDAPMLGIKGEPVAGHTCNEPCHGYVPCGHWDDKDWFQPVLHRWAFMSYALRSFLDDLESEGRADFVGG